MSANQLAAAMQAAQAGKREEARELLLALVAVDAQHELAWLWLSDLMPDLENKIIALENALAINPHRRQAQQRLAHLRQQQATLNQDQVAAAHTHTVNGRQQQAYALLQQQLQKRPDDADAWFAFSQLVADVDDQLVALHYVVTLKPLHTPAQYRYTQLQMAHADLISLGRAYETFGDWANAIRSYRLAAKQSASSDTERTIAKKRLNASKRYRKLYPQQKALTFPAWVHNHAFIHGRIHEERGEWEQAIIAYQTAVVTTTNTTEQKIVQKRLAATQKQQQLPPIKLTSPSLTLLRMGLGPFFLFVLLLLLHAGLRPWHIPVWPGLSSVSILLGSLLLITPLIGPHYRLTQKLFGETEQIDQWTKVLANTLGSLLILLPFVLLLFNALDRLALFTPVIPTR